MGTILIYTRHMHLKYQPPGAKQRAHEAQRTRGAALSAAGMKLTDLKTGARARVVSVVPAEGAAPQELERRLAELGFLPGEAVRVVARGLLSREPLAVRVGTGTFALRLFEAACIRVCPEQTPAA
ncbi:MAG: FeoA family protein [Steroidobacteraceae bacterium]|jgi:ferrous iron transport protein A